jgi:hypothetical protein
MVGAVFTKKDRAFVGEGEERGLSRTEHAHEQNHDRRTKPTLHVNLYLRIGVAHTSKDDPNQDAEKYGQTKSSRNGGGIPSHGLQFSLEQHGRLDHGTRWACVDGRDVARDRNAQLVLSGLGLEGITELAVVHWKEPIFIQFVKWDRLSNVL